MEKAIILKKSQIHIVFITHFMHLISTSINFYLKNQKMK